jgi:hypothetical protein
MVGCSLGTVYLPQLTDHVALAILLSINPRKSTRPLTAIIIMELVSRHFRRTPSSTSALERSEYARRDRDIMWYLLRGPIWDDFTRYYYLCFLLSSTATDVLLFV